MRPVSITAPAPAMAFSLPLPLTIAAFCLLWSSAFAAGKIGVADCPPLLLLTIRFLAAGAFIFGIAALQGRSFKFSRSDILVFALLGVANQAVFLGLGYIGFRTISSGLSALIVSANPVLAAVLAAVFLGESMTWRKMFGLILGVGGVAFIVQSRLSSGTDDLTGILFTLAALVSLVAGTILFKRLAPKGDLWVGNGVQSIVAGLAILPVSLATESVSDIVPTWRLFIAMAYLILFVSVFAYVLWFRMIIALGATAASSYHFLMPPLGMMFGWLTLGEHIAVADLIGIVPVALGIYLVTRPAPARTK